MIFVISRDLMAMLTKYVITHGRVSYRYGNRTNIIRVRVNLRIVSYFLFYHKDIKVQ